MNRFIFAMVVLLSFTILVPSFAQLPPGDTLTSMAFDSQNNLYFLTFQEITMTPTNIVKGQLLMPDGAFSGSEFDVSDSTNTQLSKVAFNTINQNYLVVWNQMDGTDSYIYGQFINSDGNPSGSNFLISDSTIDSRGGATLAFDNVNNRFLVIWNDQRDGDNYIYGQFVNADGTLIGVNFSVYNATATDIDFLASIAYDSTNQRYLVAVAAVIAPFYDVYGQLLNADGTPNGANFRISDSFPHVQNMPYVVYDGENRQYLVVWEDLRNAADFNIYGQLVATDGVLLGSNFPVSSDSADERVPVAVFDNVNLRFLVLWDRMTGTPDSILDAQFLLPDGTLEGSVFQPSTFTNEGGVGPAVAYNSLCDNFLISHAHFPDPAALSELMLVLLGDPCNKMPPTVSRTSPAGNTSNVALDAVVTVTFDRPMRASTITTATFTLDGGVTGAVTYDAATNTATFAPSSNFTEKTKYTATITGEVKDAIGNNLVGNFMWQFVTIASSPPAQRGGCSLLPH